MENPVIQVRLEGPSEEIVRQMAKEMGIQVSNVKQRTDSVHLYGSKVFNLHKMILETVLATNDLTNLKRLQAEFDRLSPTVPKEV